MTRIYPINSRVEFHSVSNHAHTFRGRITGYNRDNTLAFIIDDGRPKSRPVDVDRILGHARNPEPKPHIPDLIA